MPPQRPSKVPDGTTGDAPAIRPGVAAGGAALGNGDGAACRGVVAAGCGVAGACATSVGGFDCGLAAGFGAAAVCDGAGFGFAAAVAAGAACSAGSLPPSPNHLPIFFRPD